MKHLKFYLITASFFAFLTHIKAQEVIYNISLNNHTEYYFEELESILSQKKVLTKDQLKSRINICNKYLEHKYTQKSGFNKTLTSKVINQLKRGNLKAIASPLSNKSYHIMSQNNVGNRLKQIDENCFSVIHQNIYLDTLLKKLVLKPYAISIIEERKDPTGNLHQLPIITALLDSSLKDQISNNFLGVTESDWSNTNLVFGQNLTLSLDSKTNVAIKEVSARTPLFKNIPKELSGLPFEIYGMFKKGAITGYDTINNKIDKEEAPYYGAIEVEGAVYFDLEGNKIEKPETKTYYNIADIDPNQFNLKIEYSITDKLKIEASVKEITLYHLSFNEKTNQSHSIPFIKIKF